MNTRICSRLTHGVAVRLGTLLTVLLLTSACQPAPTPTSVPPTPTRVPATATSAPPTPTTAPPVAQPTDTAEAIAATATRSPTPSFTPWLIPETLTISVPGYEEEGATFRSNVPGKYEMVIESGAYSPAPSDDAPAPNGWLTMLYVYKNRSVEWGTRPESGLVGPINPDAEMGDGDLQSTQAEAEAVGKGSSITIDLQVGEYARFVPIDERGFYTEPANNRGEIVLSITYVP